MDRISGLSDELLLKILLLVPTKVAVSTSILSKRWEYLWLWLPKLEFGRRRCPEPECVRLRCFLDRNLPSHRAPVIETFRLRYFDQIFKPEDVKMWVLTALSHCLRELDILYVPFSGIQNILPSNLYTCNSLVILKLNGDILMDVPRMVSLPSLKTLKLQWVTYFNDETLQRLLSNCPVLEDLVVDLTDRVTTRKLTVVVPSLQSLSLHIPYDHEIEDGVVIETSNSKYFKLVDHCDSDHYCLIENMPNLIEAHLDVGLIDINRIIGSVASVKRLAICSDAMLDEGFVFKQLEHLELCICKDHSPNQIFRLLKASSNLQGLNLLYMNDHDSSDFDDWNEPSTVPECLLSSLQTLNFSTYVGEPEERDIVVYILEHAAHLKTATIIKSYGSDVQKLEMLKELSRSSRASTTCKLMFECACGD